MTKRFLPLILGLVLTLFVVSCSREKYLSEAQKLERLFAKEEVAIAVTDSGLGGLSVMADAVERMRQAGVFHEVRFVFFNALFSNEGGYNSLSTQEEKVRIFDSALSSLERNFSPDLILIGCNTLSTLYGKTRFSRNTGIPVIGIIKAGTELIARGLREEPDSKVIIFATQTTISEASYQEELEKMGFPGERMITQACPELVGYIENDPEGDETGMLIAAYAGESVEKLGRPDTPLFVSFNCTHYGYSLPLWEKAFEENGLSPVAFLNPNYNMADFLFEPHRAGRFDETGITIQIVSMVEISGQKKRSIGAWLQAVSPQTAEALLNYRLEENLFEWKRWVKK